MAKTRIYELGDCLSCVYLQSNNTCGCRRSVMNGVAVDVQVYQRCTDRRGYNRETFKRYGRKRKITSIYDYE